MSKSWHNSSLNGEIVAYHLSALDRRAKHLLKKIESGQLKPKQQLFAEMRYDNAIGRIAFLANTLTGIQKQRLAEREFDEWMKTLDDAKNRDPRVLAEQAPSV
jgi:hypothetical protein